MFYFNYMLTYYISGTNSEPLTYMYSIVVSSVVGIPDEVRYTLYVRLYSCFVTVVVTILRALLCSG